MPTPSDPPFSTLANARTDSFFCAALVLDAGGKVVAANESARQLWSAPDRSLIGRPFLRLLALEPLPADEAACAAEWPRVRADLLDRCTHQMTQPLHGAGRPVRVRIERATGGAGSYLATVAPTLEEPQR